ncbi:hypothetical protein [Marinimicrobium alkaliphilum]|uniref:hypothetical protein n=1 Tax=Marinimicrobium alkaliphilum TaxID=2202654 RepID=UPI000DBA0A82|nr:hypothetical protein [Marinimicrobium alkaliphilum]
MNKAQHKTGVGIPQVTQAVLLAGWFVMVVMVGGGIYESLIIDTAWPGNLALVQPELGGINRKVFWIPLHALMTLLLALSLWLCWRDRSVRNLLLLAVVFYLVVRAWSAFYFIPVALEFEAAAPEAPLPDAGHWVALSPLRTLLSLAAALCLTQVLFRRAGSGGPQDGV